uniref:Putative manganese efflux pump MntP n=1 Tax=candidate division WOR-3 bacterium TaxID=2052148 RepID=A0A7C4UBH7_UNCW3
MDCFAVAVCEGLTLKEEKYKLSWIVSFSFGFFQGLMFITGYFLGFSIIRFLDDFSRIIAFFVLLIVGVKMIIDSRKEEKVCITKNLRLLLLLSVVTSFDALGVGFGISLLKTNIFINGIIIFLTTFLISFLGVIIGEKAKIFSKNAEIIGGIILILIGIKILLFQ